MLRVTGRRPAGGGPAPKQRGGVDLLLPVTLFVVADEMLSKKNKKIKNGISLSKQTTGCLWILRVTWASPGRGRVARQKGWGVPGSRLFAVILGCLVQIAYR